MIWKVLLIGLGNISFKYDIKKSDNIIQTHARAFSTHDGFQIVGGVDPVASNRELFDELFGIRTFKTISKAFDEIQADVVVIASPTQFHLDNIQEVLSNLRPQVILLEKPASYTKDTAHQILALSLESSVPILINFIRRTDPSFQEVKSKIDNGFIKLPCKGVVWYSKGLIHNASHFIDLLSWWLGDVKKIDVIGAGRKINEWDFEPDLRIQYGDSEVYFLAKKQEEFSYYSIELLASNGRLNFSSDNAAISWHDKSESDIGLGSSCLEMDNELYQYQYNVVKDIERYLDKKKSFLPTIQEHIKSLDLVYDLVGALKLK